MIDWEDIFISKEEHDLLLLLAIRAGSICDWWYYHSNASNYKLLTCLICDEVIDGGDEMVKHAREHLRESNLLPFI